MAKYDLKVLLGEELEEEFDLYADEAQTQPLDLTGWTVEAVLEPYDLGENPPVVLTVGKGLTISAPKTGKIVLKQLVEPPEFDVGLGYWRLRTTDPEGKTTFPLRGKLVVGRP